ncbi:bifunctional adenosylcobinamide kinase/adenosylcobinamide-phosphate guanylyltransferase [Candidatus Omnitrophota bacterium]
MGKITFILGGARSGKSSYAIELAKSIKGTVAFIATSEALDEEMKKRIDLHKKKRPLDWETFEEPKDILGLLKKMRHDFEIIIIDCLTLFISNLLSEDLDESAIEDRISEMLKLLGSSKLESIIISNEVGLGIVPDNPLGRRFRDLAGKINQMVAQEADVVFFMAAGLPLMIKGGSSE